MGDVDDRWFRTGSAVGEKVPTDRNGKGLRYAARWRDPAGKQRSKSFKRKIDAQNWLTKVEAEKLRGEYVDPRAGRRTFRDYAAEYLANQTIDPSTREAVELRLRLHAFPYLGDRQMRSITPTVVQAWIKGLNASLAPTYVRTIVANVSGILNGAAADGLIGKNPCSAREVTLPRKPERKIVPWPDETVDSVRGGLPDRYQELVTVAAGTGLRQGEVFGLAVEDVDFLRGWLHVRYQVKIVGSRLVFGPPKRNKTRRVPLAQAVALRVSAHLQRFPAVSVTLPTGAPQGRPLTRQLVFTTRERKAINRNYFNDALWKPAVRGAGLRAGREDGMHALRHRFASMLLASGVVSIRELAEYLGHDDPGFTLRVYGHLMPGSDERARGAIDQALAGSADDPSESRSAPNVR